jgi:hypothetical protein
LLAARRVSEATNPKNPFYRRYTARGYRSGQSGAVDAQRSAKPTDLPFKSTDILKNSRISS